MDHAASERSNHSNHFYFLLASGLVVMMTTLPANGQTANAGQADDGLAAEDVVEEEPIVTPTAPSPAVSLQLNDPRSDFQLSMVSIGGVNLRGSNLVAGDSTVENAEGFGGITSELRLVSFIGLRGSLLGQSVADGSSLVARGGLATHFIPARLAPDLYMFLDIGKVVEGSEMSEGTQQMGVGMGFRVRFEHVFLLGVEGGMALNGIPDGDGSLVKGLARAALYDGQSLDPHVAIQFGVVM